MDRWMNFYFTRNRFFFCIFVFFPFSFFCCGFGFAWCQKNFTCTSIIYTRHDTRWWRHYLCIKLARKRRNAAEHLFCLLHFSIFLFLFFFWHYLWTHVDGVSFGYSELYRVMLCICFDVNDEKTVYKRNQKNVCFRMEAPGRY